MKITHIEAIPIRVPLKQGLTTKTAHGEHIDSPYVIVQVHTDDDLIGLGEATVAPRWSGETSASCVAVIGNLIEPALVGHDPRNITELLRRMDQVIKLNPFTKSAIEMALWDILGKATGQPLYRLLGGKVRDTVPMKMVVGAFDVPKAVALAERFLEWGVRCLKVKVGLDVATDIARVKAIRETAGPDVKIGIDANCGWNIATARTALKKMEMYDLLFVEQPVPPDDPMALAQVRDVVSIPVMADESVFTVNDAWKVAEHRAADIISLYPGKNGSIRASQMISHIAQAAGMVCHMGSNLELGIATAAMLHLAAVEPAIDSETYPGDLLGPLYHEADLICEPLKLGPEVAEVPEGPGLGVELDIHQLERWRET